MEKQYTALLYSKYSKHCTDLINRIEVSNIDFTKETKLLPVCIDNDEIRKKISNTLKGKRHNSERIKNIRKGMGCGTYKFLSPRGISVEVDNMTKFCYDENLQQSCMSEVWNNKRKSHKGWRKTND